MKENELLLNKLEKRLKKEFKYTDKSNTIRFYDMECEKDKWGYNIYQGLVLHLEEVYRHNATNENKSCRIIIIKWKYNGCANTGTTLAEFKISCNWKEKRIEQEVLKALEEYRRLMKDGE